MWSDKNSPHGKWDYLIKLHILLTDNSNFLIMLLDLSLPVGADRKGLRIPYKAASLLGKDDPVSAAAAAHSRHYHQQQQNQQQQQQRQQSPSGRRMLMRRRGVSAG